jgi:sec-independent protein translocase protein TatA
MFGLGLQELLIILAIVTVLFGAKKLPQLGSSLAKGITNFKSGIKEDQVEQAKLDNNDA